MELAELESRWSMRLRQVSLVIQVEYEDEEAEEALRKVGEKFHQNPRYVETYFACLLVGLNYIASAKSKPGEMWPQIMEGLGGLENSAANQKEITRLHRKALSHFKLQRFEHPLGRIGEIEIHAGIPLKSQARFIARLAKDYREIPNFDSQLFNELVRSISREALSGKGLDAPTWHFINQAGSVADDFVAKCIDVLDDLQDGKYDEDGGKGLPHRIISEIVSVYKQAGSIRRASGRARIARPRILWDFLATEEMWLKLPVMPESHSSRTHWLANFGGVEREFFAPQTLPGLQAQAISIPLRTIVSALTVKSTTVDTSSSTQSRSWNVPLFAEDFPVLIFDGDGVLVEQKGPLDPGLYRVLMPRVYKTKESQVEIDGVCADRKVACPLGWSNDDVDGSWVASEVDLSDANQIKFLVGSSSLVRPVSVLRKPAIEKVSIVEGVFDDQDQVVHSQAPSFKVPHLGHSEETWLCELRDDKNNLLESGQNSAVNGVIEPFQNLALDGRYVISIGEKLGSTLRAELTIVSGLQVSPSGEMRPLLDDGSGLRPWKLELSRESRSLNIELDRKATSLVVRETMISSLPLTLRPQFEKYELLNLISHNTSTWITPIKSHIEDLLNLQLFVTTPDLQRVALVAIWPNQSSQVIYPKESSSRLRFNFAELMESAKSRGAFELYLRVGEKAGKKVGNVFPKKMLAEYFFDQATGALQLEFPGGIPPTDLSICFYVSRAPWIEPLVLDVEVLPVNVPAEALGYGSLFFSVAIRDPWVQNNFPRIPDRDGSNTGEIRLEAANPELSPDHALANWLETGVLKPNAAKISTERAWQCMLLAQIQSGAIVNRGAVREFAASILKEHPDEALLSYPDDLRADESYLKHLFITGLINSPSVESNRGVSDFQTKPFLASLLTGTEDNSTQNLLDLASSEWGLTSRLLDADGGTYEPIVEALTRKSGLFSQQPFLFANFDDESLRRTLEDFVPGTLLEGGTMAAIVRQLAFDWNAAHNLVDPDGFSAALSDLSDEMVTGDSVYLELASTRPLVSTNLRESTRLRGGRIYTLDFPAVSLRLAIFARLAARDNKAAKSLWKKHHFVLQQISAAFPALVELDLTIAELFIRMKESADNE
jgi:hypothetical protein